MVTTSEWNENDQCNISDWFDNMVGKARCAYSVGLKLDGTMIAVGDNEYGQCDVNCLSDI